MANETPAGPVVPETPVSSPPPGTPAEGGLREAVDSKDDVAFALEAIDELTRDDDEGEGERIGEEGPLVPGQPPAGTSQPDPSSPQNLEQQAPKPPAVVDPQTGVPVVTPPVVSEQPAVPPVPGVPPQPTDGVVNGQQAAGGAQGQEGGTGGPERGFEQLAAEFNVNREKIIDLVAGSAYKLTAEEALEIQSEPEKMLPKLAARIHVNAVQGVLQHVAAQIPAVVNGLLIARERYAAREGEFFQQWPQLDKTKHGSAIVKLAASYRQANPNADFAEVSKAVGAQAIVMLGLHQVQNGAAPQPQRSVPFTPAVGGGASVPGQRQNPQNPYEAWDQMIEMDEAGMLDE